MMIDLGWLPEQPDWRTRLRALATAADPWVNLVALARSRMDFVRTGQLDRRLCETARAAEPVLKIALLASSTVDQLLPGIRVAGLRRGIRVETYVSDFGQYRQAALDPQSDFHLFAADVVIFALDARALAGEVLLGDAKGRALVAQRRAEISNLWRAALGGGNRIVLQHAVLPVLLPVLGANEHRLPGSPAALIAALNAGLREQAEADGVDIVALDDRAAQDGIAAWYSAPLWHRAKQEISPAAAPLYGELVLRLVDARKGRAAKCLVLDLDNTCWGGVIGDDGLEGIVIGQGNAEGEAFVAFQNYAKMLASRGVILAVCSKNDEANALEPFDKHPDMVLKRSDIASFVANWDDKATNLRRIAVELNIGIESLVFADDNPFERNIVRRELPMVAVPELPEDPAGYAGMIAAAGYFESVGVTDEDRKRGSLYQANAQMRAAAAETTDLAGYLASLDMTLIWGAFGPTSLPRVTQLANKTNQFNLTTQRYTEAEMQAVADDGLALGLHLRLVDRYADHGIIAVIVGRKTDDDTLNIESWLMSCRVLGRGVEQATLDVVAQAAARLGARRLTGTYRPSPKNNMVRAHYERLGFAKISETKAGETRWDRSLAGIEPAPAIAIEEQTK